MEVRVEADGECRGEPEAARRRQPPQPLTSMMPTTYPPNRCTESLLPGDILNSTKTDRSILFFFDLKDYISYCKDVYRCFNLSSVNFFVAGLKLFIFYYGLMASITVLF